MKRFDLRDKSNIDNKKFNLLVDYFNIELPSKDFFIITQNFWSTLQEKTTNIKLKDNIEDLLCMLNLLESCFPIILKATNTDENDVGFNKAFNILTLRRLNNIIIKNHLNNELMIVSESSIKAVENCDLDLINECLDTIMEFNHYNNFEAKDVDLKYNSEIIAEIKNYITDRKMDIKNKEDFEDKIIINTPDILLKAFQDKQEIMFNLSPEKAIEYYENFIAGWQKYILNCKRAEKKSSDNWEYINNDIECARIELERHRKRLENIESLGNGFKCLFVGEQKINKLFELLIDKKLINARREDFEAICKNEQLPKGFNKVKWVFVNPKTKQTHKQLLRTFLRMFFEKIPSEDEINRCFVGINNEEIRNIKQETKTNQTLTYIYKEIEKL